MKIYLIACDKELVNALKSDLEKLGSLTCIKGCKMPEKDEDFDAYNDKVKDEKEEEYNDDIKEEEDYAKADEEDEDDDEDEGDEE